MRIVYRFPEKIQYDLRIVQLQLHAVQINDTRQNTLLGLPDSFNVCLSGSVLIVLGFVRVGSVLSTGVESTILCRYTPEEEWEGLGECGEVRID